MKKITIISLVLLAYFSNLSAQETDKKHKFKLSGFGIETSENKLKGNPYTFDNFNAAYAAQLSIKPIDSLDFYNCDSQTNVKIGGYLSFSSINQKHKYFNEFQIGIHYNLNQKAYFLAQEDDIYFNSDTLVNNHSLLLTKDSIFHISSAYEPKYKEISISALYLFKTNPEKLFNAFAGLGVEAGRTISSYITDYLYHGYKARYIRIDSYPGLNSWSTVTIQNHKVFEYEETKIANSTFFRATLPVGVSMRFSKKDNLFGKMSMSFSARFGLEMMFNPDLGTNAAFFRGYAFGFKCLI